MYFLSCNRLHDWKCSFGSLFGNMFGVDGIHNCLQDSERPTRKDYVLPFFYMKYSQNISGTTFQQHGDCLIVGSESYPVLITTGTH